MNDNITLITGFLDIDRKNWHGEFKRDAHFYIDSFLVYLEYDYNMICFIDDRYLDEILEVYSKSPYQKKVFISINRDWLVQNTWAWKHFDIETVLLQSDGYKELMEKRFQIMCPEGNPEAYSQKRHLFPQNIHPEYNSMMHSKIDFINYAIDNKYVKTDYVYWCDFGYFYSQHKQDRSSYPKTTLDVSKICKDKITLCCVSELQNIDADPYFTLIYVRELIIAAFFGGPIGLMKNLQELYHKCVEELYKIGISDVDQHILLRCALVDPEMFNMQKFAEWPQALVYYSK